eukprot:172312_1
MSLRILKIVRYNKAIFLMLLFIASFVYILVTFDISLYKQIFSQIILINNEKPINYNNNNIKIIYRVTYHNEPVLPYIIEYFDNIVDEFIIIENELTFAGKRNQIQWNNDKLRSPTLHSKITHIVIKEEETKHLSNAWHRDFYTKNKHYEYISKNYCSNNISFILYVADCDEILNMTILNHIDNIYNLLNNIGRPIWLKQKLFYYNFNYVSTNVWNKPFLVNDKLFGCHNTEITLKHNPFFDNSDYASLRGFPQEKRIELPNGGIHVSYFLSVKDIQKKIKSSSHQEYNKEPYINLKHIQNCVNTGKDLFLREMEWIQNEDWSALPPFWSELQTTLYNIQNISL